MRPIILGLTIVALVAVSIMIGWCDTNPVKLNQDQALALVRNMVFVKNPDTNQCFGVIGTRTTGEFKQNGLSVTWVPCEQVEYLLVNKTGLRPAPAPANTLTANTNTATANKPANTSGNK